MIMQMIIGVITLDIHLLSCSSLKEKRIIIKGLKDKIRHKFNVSIAEVDFQNKWQRALIGIVHVGNEYKFIEKNLNSIFHLIDINNQLEILNHSYEFI